MAEGGEAIEMHDLTVTDDVFDDETQETPLLGSLQQELLQSKVDDLYRKWGKTPDMMDPNAFEYGKDSSLFVKTDEGKVRLTHKNNPGKFISFNEAKRRLGGASKMVRYLSISEVNPRVASQLEETRRKLPVESEVFFRN